MTHPAPLLMAGHFSICIRPSGGAITANRGTHEKAQQIWVFIKGQKDSEKCASENRLETQARRKEGGRRDWDGLNGNGGRGAKAAGSVQPGGVMGRTSDTATGLPFLALTAKPQW